jgi:hypothetical protein
MRLEGICSIAEANAWLPCFIEHFNQKFAKCARNSKNLHRPLTESDLELDDIFTWQEPRKVTKNLTMTYDKCIYMLEPTELNHKLLGNTFHFWSIRMALWLSCMKDGRSTTASSINWLDYSKMRLLRINGWVQFWRISSSMKNWKNRINVPGPRKVCRVVKLRKLLLNKET